MSKMPKAMPRDSEGITYPHDHDEICDASFIIRKVPSNQIRDGRISSGLFKSSSLANDKYRGMSVDLLTLAEGRVYKSDNILGAVKLLSGVPRQSQLCVGYDPIVGAGENIAHCQIWRFEKEQAKAISNPASKNMHKHAEWHEKIEGVRLRNG